MQLIKVGLTIYVSLIINAGNAFDPSNLDEKFIDVETVQCPQIRFSDQIQLLHTTNNILNKINSWQRTVWKITRIIWKHLDDLCNYVERDFEIQNVENFTTNLMLEFNRSFDDSGGYSGDKMLDYILDKLEDKFRGVNSKQSSLGARLDEEFSHLVNVGFVERVTTTVQIYDHFRDLFSFVYFQNFLTDVTTQFNIEDFGNKTRLKRFVVEVTAWIHENYKWLVFGKRCFDQLSRKLSDYILLVDISRQLVEEAELGVQLPQQGKKLVCELLHDLVSNQGGHDVDNENAMKNIRLAFINSMESNIIYKPSYCQNELDGFLKNVIMRKNLEARKDKMSGLETRTFYGYNLESAYNILKPSSSNRTCFDSFVNLLLGDSYTGLILIQTSNTIKNAIFDLQSVLHASFEPKALGSKVASRRMLDLEPESYESIAVTVEKGEEVDEEGVICSANLCNADSGAETRTCVNQNGRRTDVWSFCFEYAKSYM